MEGASRKRGADANAQLWGGRAVARAPSPPFGAKKSRARGRGSSLGRKRPGRAEASATPHIFLIGCNAQRGKPGVINKSNEAQLLVSDFQVISAYCNRDVLAYIAAVHHKRHSVGAVAALSQPIPMAAGARLA